MAEPLPPLTELLDGRRIDWERVILEILRTGWYSSVSERVSLRVIGEACGRSYTWAWNLKNIPDTEPRFHDALLLIGLWAEKTGGVTLPLHQEMGRRRR